MATIGRLKSLFKPQDASTAKTETIDLEINEDISNIFIQMKGTNSSDTPTAHPATMVSKIQLFAGGKTLFSATGIECQALNMIEKQAPDPLDLLTYINDTMAVATYRLDFGRYLWDPDYALDPMNAALGAAGKLTLEITHNKAAGGSAPDAGNLGVWANVFQQKRKRTGFFRFKEQRSILAVNSTNTENIQLDATFPTRRLIVQSRAAGKQPWEQYNKLTLRDGGVTLINDESVSNLIKILSPKPFREMILQTSTTGAVPTYVTPTYNTAVVWTPLGATAAYFASSQALGGYPALIGNAAVQSQGIVEGQAPHGAINLDAAAGVNPMLPETWIMPSGSLSMDITHGSSVGSSTYINVLQQNVLRY